MRARALGLAALFCAGVGAQTQAQDLGDLLPLLEGDFDNRKQYEAQFDDPESALERAERERSEAGASPSDGGDGEPVFSHLGLQRRAVSVPFLGEHVVYAQINRRGDPEDVYRQNLQVFRQTEDGTIAGRIHSFRDREQFRNILQRPEAFASLTADDLVSALPEACDPRWAFEDGVWVSRVSAQRCVIISRRTGKPRHIQSTEYLEAGLIRNEESGYTPDGEMIFGLPEGTFYRYDRVELNTP